jgi:hypothetical protein
MRLWKPPPPIVGHFGLPRFHSFTMYVDMVYTQMNSKSYEPRNAKMTYNFGQMEYSMFYLIASMKT